MYAMQLKLRQCQCQIFRTWIHPRPQSYPCSEKCGIQIQIAMTRPKFLSVTEILLGHFEIKVVQLMGRWLLVLFSFSKLYFSLNFIYISDFAYIQIVCVEKPAAPSIYSRKRSLKHVLPNMISYVLASQQCQRLFFSFFSHLLHRCRCIRPRRPMWPENCVCFQNNFCCYYWHKLYAKKHSVLFSGSS